MHIDKCKWYNDAESPVLFMIDDLANTWVDTNNNGQVDWGEDWGYFRDEDRSSFRFLQEQLLAHFPDVKVTFFVPVGVRVGMTDRPLFKQVSLPINADEASKDFFQSIHHHPRFEIAYHGTTHGKVGPHAADFIQEWELFGSVEEAVERIGEGIAIYEDAIGERPQGGKYCGYMSNEHSDESINQAGFTWWCRYWNRGSEHGDPISGQDKNPLTNYDVKRFASQGVIDIPSTLDGGLLRGIYQADMSVKGIAKRLLRKPIVRWKLREIDYLLEHRLVISIQEHIAPARDDGERQSPNIFDDCTSLVGIFHYLEDKKVWYCTGTELANYVNVRDHVQVVLLEEDRFIFDHDANYTGQEITLKFEAVQPCRILLPNLHAIEVVAGVVTVPVLQGEYTIIKGGV